MNVTEYILGIDLGTSSVKCILYSPETLRTEETKRSYPTETPQPGWTQQNPNDWQRATRDAIRDLFEKTGATAQQVRGVGVCGAAHIGVLLDEKNRPCVPSLLWNDCRTREEVNFLNGRYGDSIRRETLNHVGCAWTLPHLCWLNRHYPDDVARATSFLTSKDYLVFLMTGERSMDRSSATATLMYNPRANGWSEELVMLSSLKGNAFPSVYHSTEVVGTTGRWAAENFGLPENIPVIAGALDSVSEFWSISKECSRDELLRLGTAGGIMLLDEQANPSPGILVYPYPCGDMYLKQMATTSCCLSINWIRNILFGGRKDDAASLYSMFDSLAAQSPPGAEGLFFHPYLQGERAPYDRPDLRGSFIGLTLHHGPEHIARAVLEGTAFSLLDGRLLLQQARDSETPRIDKVIGGGTRSALWLSIMANVLNRTLYVIPQHDSAFGIASLTARALNKEDNQPSENEMEQQHLEPDPQQVAFYKERFEEYRRIAQKLLELCPSFGQSESDTFI